MIILHKYISHICYNVTMMTRVFRLKITKQNEFVIPRRYINIVSCYITNETEEIQKALWKKEIGIEIQIRLMI